MKTIFSDRPDFTIEMDSLWLHQTDVPTVGVDLWYVDILSATSINTVVENLLMAMTSEQYLESTAAGIQSMMNGIVILSKDLVVGNSGQVIGLVEYVLQRQDGMALRMLCASQVQNSKAICATFATPAQNFNSFRTIAEPSLLSIQIKE